MNRISAYILVAVLVLATIIMLPAVAAVAALTKGNIND